eukprot:1157266-Pelagomonas_calceolata.AAC.3
MVPFCLWQHDLAEKWQLKSCGCKDYLALLAKQPHMPSICALYKCHIQISQEGEGRVFPAIGQVAFLGDALNTVFSALQVPRRYSCTRGHGQGACMNVQTPDHYAPFIFWN